MFDPQEVLKSVSVAADEDIDLAVAAIALAALDQPGISADRYLHHLKILAEETGTHYLTLLEDGGQENAETRLAALRHVLSDEHGYSGDTQNYDDLQNANLIRVIERNKGLPIALCVLYIHVARAQGWDIAGLNIPGHFACRLDVGAERLIFDPFEDCKVLEAPDLRFLVKKTMGPHAELSAAYFEPASNRDILVRLQNNIKHRLVEAEDYAGALKIVERMRAIDPSEFRLLLDAGVLYARVEQTRAAIDALEDYIKKAPKDRSWDGERHDAQLLLDELRGRLN